MNAIAFGYTLFAQINRWERLGDGLHRGRGRIDMVDLLPVVIVVAVVGIAIFAVARVRKRNDMTEHCNDPEKLFRELSLAHQLDRPSQKLLRRLAEAMHLEQPADIFLQPAYLTTQTPTEFASEEAQLQALRERLF